MGGRGTDRAQEATGGRRSDFTPRRGTDTPQRRRGGDTAPQGRREAQSGTGDRTGAEAQPRGRRQGRGQIGGKAQDTRHGGTAHSTAHRHSRATPPGRLGMASPSPTAPARPPLRGEGRRHPAGRGSDTRQGANSNLHKNSPCKLCKTENVKKGVDIWGNP